jgi:hypothetical protein
MVGLGETLGSPWPPLAIRPWKRRKTKSFFHIFKVYRETWWRRGARHLLTGNAAKTKQTNKHLQSACKDVKRRIMSVKSMASELVRESI